MKTSNIFKAALGLAAGAAFFATSVTATPLRVGDDQNAATGAPMPAVIETSGCLATDVSCTLAELAAGGSMTINGITIDGAAVDLFGAYEGLEDDLEIYGIDNIIDPFLGGFGLRAVSGFPLDLTGFDTGDLFIDLNVSVAAGLEMLGLGGVNQVFSIDDNSSSLLDVEVDGDFFLGFTNGDDGILTDQFAEALTSFTLSLSLFNFAEDGEFVLYDGFQIAIEAADVAEPATIAVVGLALLGLFGVRRKS